MWGLFIGDDQPLCFFLWAEFGETNLRLKKMIFTTVSLNLVILLHANCNVQV